MAKYIDMDNTEKSLRQYADQKHANGEIELANGILKAVCKLKTIPAADVKEVSRGKWEYVRTESNMAVVECTECGQEQFAISDVVAKGKFCPSCGAEMEVE